MPRHTIAAAFAAVALCLTVLGGSAGASAATCPVISARLGLHYPYNSLPENSVAAIDAAHLAGAPKVEVDVQFSRDRIPVVIHNSTVDRTTTHKGAVSSYTAAQLEAMRLRLAPGSATVTSQHPPSLFAVLSRAKADKMAVSIEIKPSTLSYTLARDLLYRMWWVGDEGSIDLRSAVPSVLAQMRTAGYWGHLTLTVEAAKILTSPSPYWMEGIDYDVQGNFISAADVTALHAAGVRVDAFTPDTPAQFAMVPPGVDQITTDNVATALASC
jgi:glycerophosphoryl diester phosphodiesterase